MLSQFLCFMGCHDWRNMDGHCTECGKTDDLWMRDMHPGIWQPVQESNLSPRIQSPVPQPIGQRAVILLTIAAIVYYTIFAFMG